MENCLGINTYWYFSAQIPRSKSRYLPECFSPQNPFFHHASLNLKRPKRRAQHSSGCGKHTCWAQGKPRSSCYPFWKAPTCDCFRVVGCYLVRHLADMSHEDDFACTASREALVVELFEFLPSQRMFLSPDATRGAQWQLWSCRQGQVLSSCTPEQAPPWLCRE